MVYSKKANYIHDRQQSKIRQKVIDMSGNLDKILADLQKRTSTDLKKIEKENEEKKRLWMNERR